MEFSRGEVIQEGNKTVVFRARRADGLPVVIKEWRGLYHEVEDVARARREYEMLRAASGDGVIGCVGFTSQKGLIRLVTEDVGATSLWQLFSSSRPGLLRALRIGVSVATALERLHRGGLIHKDVTPANIVIHSDDDGTGCKLIDFGIASELRREEARFRPTRPHLFEGTPLFMSPEQTGRMNRAVDCRSDLYSFGATLYWLLSGQAPFAGDDRLALLHAHIARAPTPLHEVDPECPRLVSEIVGRLLAKRAEERYQTAHGLACDLARCVEALEAGVTAALDFPLQTQDVSTELILPERLYGREEESAALASVFARSQQGDVASMFVAGYSGIGKTALISEVPRLLAMGRGHWLQGKAQQFHRATPYAALIDAVHEFAEGVLAQSGEVLDRWRAEIQAAVGESGRVLTELMPALEPLLGEQPPLADVTPGEAENRIHEVLRRFVQALGGEAHPLVLFLDDLQWADLPLLRLVKELALDPDASHLLLLGAYRENEVDATHPLRASLDTIEKRAAHTKHVRLAPLSEAHIRALLADALALTDDDVATLAALVAHKTGGNPFFIGQFLQRLWRDGLLFLEGSTWQWELEEIQRADLTDNVVALMTDSLGRLPEDTQKALQMASCIGGRFSLPLLAAGLERSRHETQRALAPALAQGLIQSLTPGYWMHHEDAASVDDAEIPEFAFRFAHDRITQAAFESLPSSVGQTYHLRLGQLLHDAMAEGDVSVFDVVEQLNQARDLMADGAAREQLARLNQEAGARALQSAAYHAAHDYFSLALALRSEDAWERHYQASLGLSIQAATAAQLSGHFDVMEALVSQARRRAHDVVDRMRVEEVRILSFSSRNMYREGVMAALDALEELGIVLPRTPTEKDVEAALVGLLGQLDGVAAEALLALPELDDAQRHVGRKILVGISSAAYLSTPHLLPLISAELVKSTLQHGASRDSSYGFVVFGLVLCAVGMFEQGYAMGKVAVAFLQRWADKGLATRVGHIFNTHIRVFKDPYHESNNALQEVVQLGLAHGDLEYACWAAQNQCILSLYAGVPLEELTALMDRSSALMRRHQQQNSLACNESFRQLTKNLVGQALEPHRLHGPEYDEQQAIQELEELGFRGALFLLATAMVMVRTLFGRPEEAVEIGRQFDRYEDGATATAHVPTFCFYDALANLAAAPQEGRERIDTQLERLRQWAQFAPENQAHRVALLEAECQRVDGDNLQALTSYARAIGLAQEHGLVSELPLAYELVGRFHLSRGESIAGRAYLLEARFGWEQWGAIAKATQISHEFAGFLGTRAATPSMKRSSSTSTTGTEETADALDLEALLRASQALSREVRLEVLLDKIMQLMVQSAGATGGYLLMEQDEETVIQASESADGALLVEDGTSLSLCKALPQSIVQYVKRTNRPLVLEDATRDTRFRRDPALAGQASLSVLCAPISHQGQRSAIVYLENRLTQGAFTHSRTRVVELLGAQVAISLENALLYGQLEDKVTERTERLQSTLSQLQDTHDQLALQHQQLQETQIQLIQAEKMASLGTLVAGVAHEVNNPINYSFTGANNLSRRLAQFKEFLFTLAEGEEEVLDIFTHHFSAFHKNLRAVTDGIERINTIVRALRSFSRIEEAEYKAVDVVGGLQTTLALLQNQHQDSLRFVEQYDARPMLECWPAQLNQAFLNIATNGCQAIGERAEPSPDGGELHVSTSLDDGELLIRFRDNGVGMSPAVQAKIFEPFFTTRDVGAGAGIGMSVAFGIVEKHKGRIEVRSAPGEGTTVDVFLPLMSS